MGIGKLDLVLIIVAVVLILFFGAKKIPELARGVGQAGGELKKGFKEGIGDDKSDKKEKDDKDNSSVK